MTLSEYREKILKDLVGCSESEGLEIITRAQGVLDKSEIGEESQRKFWLDLHIEAEGLSFIGEAQGSESLSAILSKVREVIGEKAKGK